MCPLSLFLDISAVRRFRVATQHDAILEALSGTRLQQVLRQPVTITRVCLMLCLVSHFAWFGGLWVGMTRSYIVPDAGTAVAHVPSLATYVSRPFRFGFEFLLT